MPDNFSIRDVAIVTGDLVKTGGMDRANYALADYLSRTGRSLEIVAHRAASDLTRRPQVKFHQVPKPLHSYMLGEPLLDGAGRLVARKTKARGGVSIVNGGNCLAGPVNWIHYVHAAYRPQRSLGRRALLRAWYNRRACSRERAALGRARLVIANSITTRRTLVETLGVPPGAAHVVYYGIDPVQFAPGSPDRAAEARLELGWPNRPTLAFVGALGDERKGFDTVFAAFQELCRGSSWDANLVAVGAGAEVESWRERARAAGLSERIRLLGFRTDVERILAACDGLVAPARYEAFGLGVAEAIATGLPAIVSAHAGVAELYPEELSDLLLDDPESASELSRKLDGWRRLSSQQLPFVRQFSERIRSRSWDDMAADIAGLMERFAL